MYRIKLASGEETVYRSVEELALGINSGVITPEAQVFHKKTGTWVPIVRHPDYQTALTRAPLPARPSAAWEQLSEAQLSEPLGEPQAVLIPMPEEVEQSGAQRNRRWMLVGAGVAVIAAVGIGYLVVGRGKSKTLASQASPMPNPGTRPATQTPAGGTTTGSVTAPSSGTSPVPSASAAGRPGGDSSRGPSADSLTPEVLGQHYASAYQTVRSDLDAGLAKSGVLGLFTEARLSTADSVIASRRAIASATKILSTYRGRTRKIEQAYRDSSQALRKSGKWTTAQAGVWDARPLRGEPPEAAKAADSLLANADQLLSLLSDPNGKYSLAGGLISIEDPSAADRYEAIRTWFADRLKESAATPAPQVSLPLEAIRAEFAGSALPTLAPKAPEAPAATDSSH